MTEILLKYAKNERKLANFDLIYLPKGNSGKKTTVKVNIFPVTAMRDAVVYLYDIKIAAKGKLPAAIGRGCFRQFEVLMRSVYPASHFVYDGTSLAYSSTEVKEPCSFTILADKNMEIDIPPLEQGNYYDFGICGSLWTYILKNTYISKP